MVWYFLSSSGTTGRYGTWLKWHIVSASNLEQVISELRKRGGKDIKTRLLGNGETILLDMGGISIKGLPILKTVLPGGLSVGVFPQHVRPLREAVRAAELRAGSYFKIHLLSGCVCLSADQRDGLLRWLDEIGDGGHQAFNQFLDFMVAEG